MKRQVLAAVLPALLFFSCSYGTTVEEMNALIATPGKLVYDKGETFDRSVLRVYGIYDYGETVEIPVSRVNISGTGPAGVFNANGDWSIGISYNDLHTDFLVKVISAGSTVPGSDPGTGDDSDDGLDFEIIFKDY
jgi:hypothetical protein